MAQKNRRRAKRKWERERKETAVEGEGEEAAPHPRPTSILWDFFFSPVHLNHKTPCKSQWAHSYCMLTRKPAELCAHWQLLNLGRQWRGLRSPEWLPDMGKNQLRSHFHKDPGPWLNPLARPCRAGDWAHRWKLPSRTLLWPQLHAQGPPGTTLLN